MIIQENVVLNRTVVVNSDYVHPDDHTHPTYEITPGFKPFTVLYKPSNHYPFYLAKNVETTTLNKIWLCCGSIFSLV